MASILAVAALGFPANQSSLVNLSVLISSSAVSSCAAPAVMVRGGSFWDNDLNDGAGGKYIYLCATYDAVSAPSHIVALQAAGLTSKYKPACAVGFSPLVGNLNEGSRNPGQKFLCVQYGGTSASAVPVSSIVGAHSSTGCPKNFRGVSSVEAPSTPFDFDPSGVGVLLCVPAPRPPLPPPPPPGPHTAITDLTVLVVSASSQGAVRCPSKSLLMRPMNATPDWDLDFNSGAGGDYTYLCLERTAGETPMTSLLAFHTPSAAQPFGDCPQNYTKVLGNSTAIGANDLNHGSRNVGAMFLCYLKGGGSPIYDLAGFAGGGNGSSAKGCTAAGWEAVGGPPAYPGLFDFDPMGDGLTLCVVHAP